MSRKIDLKNVEEFILRPVNVEPKTKNRQKTTECGTADVNSRCQTQKVENITGEEKMSRNLHI